MSGAERREGGSPTGEEPTRTNPVAVIVAALVLCGGIALMVFGGGGTPPLTRGDRAPAFDLPVWPGPGQLDLGQLEGRVALINFWATWCKPCKDEMPAMERLYRELAPEGFELVAISVDENEQDIASFVRQVPVTFPILRDPSQQVARQYQTMGFPESLLVDREGRIIERYVGPRDWDHPDHLARIRRLMGG